MKTHEIDLSKFLCKGHVSCECRDGVLHMTTLRSIPTQRFDAEHLSIGSYIYLPEKYRLPLRIDITAKIDAPGLYVMLGKGHVNFGTMWQDNRRIDDIYMPTRKITNFHNHVELNTYTSISLLYGLKEMQILVNGEERFYSSRERYSKPAALQEMKEEGLALKIACDKLVNLCISSLCITEYDESLEVLRTSEELPAALTKNEAVPYGEKPVLETCISRLPKQIQNEIMNLDGYLTGQKAIKFKRQIEKNGNKITYVASDHGFSYAIYLSNDYFDHSLQWYLITSGKPETWHRKADQMEETLSKLEQDDPHFAKHMYGNLEDCVGCYQTCLARTRYRFHEQEKTTCHGKLKFKADTSGFEDVRCFFAAISQVVKS
jgi:hypothetical protein